MIQCDHLRKVDRLLRQPTIVETGAGIEPASPGLQPPAHNHSATRSNRPAERRGDFRFWHGRAIPSRGEILQPRKIIVDLCGEGN